MITYYQRSRHLFGPLKFEILDAGGKVVDTTPRDQAPGHQPGRLVHAA